MVSFQAEANLSMRRSKRHGVLLCATTSLLTLIFLYGLWQGSYWALAVPVAIGVLTALWLMFWIGYTISTINGIPAEADQYDSTNARWIARCLCAASVLLSVVFLLGVLRQSYWALAIPVAGAVLSVLGMVFWIGWAIVTQKTTLPATQADCSQPQLGDSSS
jgi:hypothetical protein